MAELFDTAVFDPIAQHLIVLLEQANQRVFLAGAAPPATSRLSRAPQSCRREAKQRSPGFENDGFSVGSVDSTKTVTCVSAGHRPLFVGLTGFEPATP
jgi:hypothetical protein